VGGIGGGRQASASSLLHLCLPVIHCRLPAALLPAIALGVATSAAAARRGGGVGICVPAVYLPARLRVRIARRRRGGSMPRGAIALRAVWHQHQRSAEIEQRQGGVRKKLGGSNISKQLLASRLRWRSRGYWRWRRGGRREGVAAA
jgi:hypothetical protein